MSWGCRVLKYLLLLILGVVADQEGNTASFMTQCAFSARPYRNRWAIGTFLFGFHIDNESHSQDTFEKELSPPIWSGISWPSLPKRYRVLYQTCVQHHRKRRPRPPPYNLQPSRTKLMMLSSKGVMSGFTVAFYNNNNNRRGGGTRSSSWPGHGKNKYPYLGKTKKRREGQDPIQNNLNLPYKKEYTPESSNNINNNNINLNKNLYMPRERDTARIRQ